MRKLLRSLAIPLALISYGLLAIVAQPLIIRFLVYVLALSDRSLPMQVLGFLFYLMLNALLLYLWFRLTKFVKNREVLRKGSSA
ncbi:MAG: hypothetical protein QXX81_04275 [Zestosphaera sp.]